MTPDRLNLALKKHHVDGMLVLSWANVSYLAGIISRDSFLLVTKNAKVFITDSRYVAEAKKKLGSDFYIQQSDDSLFKTVQALCRRHKVSALGFEEQHASYALYARLKKSLRPHTKLTPLQGVIEEPRAVKETWELARIKKACAITVQALQYAKKIIAPGKTELEVAGQIERFIKQQGCHGASFDIIVGSGPNSAYPHHLTSGRKLHANEPVLIDMGVDYLGYKSDLTRVLFLGKMSPLVQKVYSIVAAAQHEAIKAIAPGTPAKLIDAAARQYIAAKGYGGSFGHALGHGVGLEVHEAPRISSKEDKPVIPGMVFTIEPGIYLPGKFGIRIEDMVLCTNKGAEVLSGTLNK